MAYGVGTQCYVWDLKAGALRVALEEPGRELDSLVFGEFSRRLAVSFLGHELGGRLRVWRLEDSDGIEVLDMDIEERVEVRLPSDRIDVAYISRSSVGQVERNELFDATTGELLEALSDISGQSLFELFAGRRRENRGGVLPKSTLF